MRYPFHKNIYVSLKRTALDIITNSNGPSSFLKLLNGLDDQLLVKMISKHTTAGWAESNVCVVNDEKTDTNQPRFN